MATSLTRALFEAHLASSTSRPRVVAPGSEAAVRIDQAVMDAGAALLVFPALLAMGRERSQVDPALVCVEAPTPAPPFEATEALRIVQRAARRSGVHFSRPGNGRAHHVHALRFAAPGRTVLACASGAAAAGALGSLVLPATELELGAALASAIHTAVLPPVWAIHLAGTLPPWVDGYDLVWALAARLPSGGAGGALLEYTGEGVATLPMGARLAAARLGEALGATASVFPSDAETRRWLAWAGREPDWKALGGDAVDGAERVLELQLDTLEPTISRGDRIGGFSLRDAAGAPVGRAVLGADAGLADLLLVGALLRGRTVASGVDLAVIPGSRQIRSDAATRGALAALVAAGARVLDAESLLAPAPPAGAALLCGAPPAAAGRATVVYHVGPAALAASALAGCIADPRELPRRAAELGAEERFQTDEIVLVKPAPATSPVAIGPRETLRPLPQSPPMVTTLRGVVLLRLGDRVSSETILPGGPKVRRDGADFETLAAHLFADVDRDFPARARAHGGGFIVVGADYGLGARDPLAAFAMVRLGVRGVLARSFDPATRSELVRRGVLALRFTGRSDADGLHPGDELEIPGLPDVLEPKRPLTVRDLTRGSQWTLHHDMGAREIEMVRAGGLLAALAPAASVA